MGKVHALIIGSGHYSTGTTAISGTRRTDKDSGVLLPSVLDLQAKGIIEQVGIAARDGKKLQMLKGRLAYWKDSFGWSDEVRLFPDNKTTDEKAYAKALSEMPKPCVALIAVPDFLHKEVMLECIRNAVPFLIVKPAVTKLDDLYSVLNEMEEHSVFGMVDYHKVFDEANILLKAEYQAGEYGRLNHAYSLMTQRRDMLDIYKRWLEGDNRFNINHYLGSHYIHMVGFITQAIPIDVRATSQYGYAADFLKRDVADLIETQVRWKDKSGHVFTSYHISGWNDPKESESMTFQEIHLLCENGHIDSDQRYRGLRKVLSGKGTEVPNPYFFNLGRNLFGEADMNSKYGFKSVSTFVEATIKILEGKMSLGKLDKLLPTLRESETVTAILEAADHSLANNSKIVEIVRRKGRFSFSENEVGVFKPLASD